MRWQLKAAVWCMAVLLGAFVLDQLAWIVRGSPIRQVEVRVITAMELKNHKEDFGTAELEVVSCEATVLPFPASGTWLAPCWWIERHRDIIHRY